MLLQPANRHLRPRKEAEVSGRSITHHHHHRLPRLRLATARIHLPIKKVQT